MVAVARVSTMIGFVGAIIGAVDWYRRRCRGGQADVPTWVAAAACLALPAGGIFWAIFVDAIAYHYGEDLVRPAFDYTIMYLVLGALVPVTVGVPLLCLFLWRSRSRSPARRVAPPRTCRPGRARAARRGARPRHKWRWARARTPQSVPGHETRSYFWTLAARSPGVATLSLQARGVEARRVPAKPIRQEVHDQLAPLNAPRRLPPR